MGGLVRRYRGYFLFAGLLSLAINVLLLVPPVYMLQLFDRVISSRSPETLIMLTVAAALALGMMGLLDALRGWLLMGCGIALDRLLGPRVFEGLLAPSITLTADERAHGLRDVHTLRTFLTGAGIFALFDAPWLPFFLVLIYFFHPALAAVATGGALIMIALAVVNDRLTRKPIERVQEGLRRSGAFGDSAARNREVVHALGMLPAVTRRWSKLNDQTLAEQIGAGGRALNLTALSKVARQVIQTAMLATGAYLVISQLATPGVMLAATIILGRALAPVEMLVAGWRQLVEVQDVWKRLDSLIAKQAHEQPNTELPVPQGEIKVERVVFGVPGLERPIIRGASFDLQPGDSLGILGPSAAGKSTLARLLVGIWKPTAGHVRLDGADITTWRRERLAPHIGYLPQQVELFAGTVAENIARLGKSDAASVIRAGQRAHAHEMILRLPKGYDSPVGDAGERLSPGQRQMVAFARALYGGPRVVILDEPNADLDVDGEDALMRALRQLREERITLVVIAHRPHILGLLDKLLVLKEGSVEIFGPRADIVSKLARVVTPARGVA
ncbi:MAG: type I secretion system permease/ATPase [Betaproteobacteria bacterium]|nr:type I secretion system permease/ATPase [Betaproteobacteria bacterium]